jgi:hypothetical protein
MKLLESMQSFPTEFSLREKLARARGHNPLHLVLLPVLFFLFTTFLTAISNITFTAHSALLSVKALYPSYITSLLPPDLLYQPRLLNNQVCHKYGLQPIYPRSAWPNLPLSLQQR